MIDISLFIRIIILLLQQYNTLSTFEVQEKIRIKTGEQIKYHEINNLLIWMKNEEYLVPAPPEGLVGYTTSRWQLAEGIYQQEIGFTCPQPEPTDDQHHPV